jgi:tellurite resistance protein TehA-like permease
MGSYCVVLLLVNHRMLPKPIRPKLWTNLVIGFGAVFYLGMQVDGDAVHADLNGTPRAAVVGQLVRAGVAVEAAGPRHRLEDATDLTPGSSRP